MIPGDDDLDLYLLDSAGNLVAQSTNGGTDETIDLVPPADDTYTMVVHGWPVPNPPLAYSLPSWEVPAAPVAASPSTAPACGRPRTTGTVTLSWSGLTRAQLPRRGLPRDGAGRIGLTVVSVDT